MDAHLEQEDLTHMSWRSIEWVAAFGLSRQNVLDYFSESPFFDRQSTNQQLRMQTRFQMSDEAYNVEPQLTQLIGIEFHVVEASPPDLFVIVKRYRSSPTIARPLAAYYVLNDTIFQAPDLYSVLSNRLVRSLSFDETTSIQNAQLAATHALRTSLGAAREAAPAYDTRSSAIRWLPSQPKEDPAEATEISIQGDAMMARALEGQARRKALKSMAPSGAPAQVGTVRGTPAAGTPAAGGDRGTPGRL